MSLRIAAYKHLVGGLDYDSLGMSPHLDVAETIYGFRFRTSAYLACNILPTLCSIQTYEGLNMDAYASFDGFYLQDKDEVLDLFTHLGKQWHKKAEEPIQTNTLTRVDGAHAGQKHAPAELIGKKRTLVTVHTENLTRVDAAQGRRRRA